MIKKTKLLLGFDMNTEPLQTILIDSFKVIKKRTHNIFFACGNPHSFVVSLSDKNFDTSLKSADYLVSDGVGIILAGKLLGLSVGPRIAGYDYFTGLHNELSKQAVSELGRKGRIFYFGSSQKVLDLISNKMESEYPDLEVCGMLSPPYGEWSEEENQKMIDEINRAQPDVLWVGMTAPKQEKWIYENRKKLNVSIIGAIGAVFDFFAGTYIRSPEWVCKIGAEWIYRLIKEPKRMWKRTFVSAPVFIFTVIRYHVF